MTRADERDTFWPSCPLEAWADTAATLHLWTQIVGKIRLALSPPLNHSWHVTLYVTARGLTTSPIPYGLRTFQIDFDFLAHRLTVEASDGAARNVPLAPQSVATFYRRVMSALGELGIFVELSKTPNEVMVALPLDADEVHRSYDPAYVERFFGALVQAERVLQRFRGRFIGKCSPVHFFWGAPDLAVTRFSGRRAPPHPGGIPNLPDRITREAYSHEVSSAGFWWGGGPAPYPAFYSYAYPEPEGFAQAPVGPAAAFYSAELREFVLPYEAVRSAPSPDEALLEFLETTYAAAANAGRWDRAALEVDLSAGLPGAR